MQIARARARWEQHLSSERRFGPPNSRARETHDSFCARARSLTGSSRINMSGDNL